MGAILLADKPKATAAQAITELKKLGVKKTVMLTGDAQAAAEKAAQKVGVDEFHAGLMPGDKVKHMEQLISGKDRGAVLFVGDGINDAPVLWRWRTRAWPWAPWAPTRPSRRRTWC